MFCQHIYLCVCVCVCCQSVHTKFHVLLCVFSFFSFFTLFAFVTHENEEWTWKCTYFKNQTWIYGGTQTKCYYSLCTLRKIRWMKAKLNFWGCDKRDREYEWVSDDFWPTPAPRSLLSYEYMYLQRIHADREKTRVLLAFAVAIFDNLARVTVAANGNGKAHLTVNDVFRHFLFFFAFLTSMKHKRSWFPFHLHCMLIFQLPF